MNHPDWVDESIHLFSCPFTCWPGERTRPGGRQKVDRERDTRKGRDGAEDWPHKSQSHRDFDEDSVMFLSVRAFRVKDLKREIRE